MRNLSLIALALDGWQQPNDARDPFVCHAYDVIGQYSIIGANGRSINPADFEADAIVAGLEGMDDDTIIGQLPGLMARFPALTSRASASRRVAPLMNRALARPTPLGLGASAATSFSPGVVPSAPGPVGLSCIPIAIASIAAGVTTTIAVTPQSIFKPYKLVVDSVIQPFFMLSNFQNGTVPFIDAPGELPASIFTPDGLPNLKKITSNPGISITINARNRDVVAHSFNAVLYGEAAPTQCG